MKLSIANWFSSICCCVVIATVLPAAHASDLTVTGDIYINTSSPQLNFVDGTNYKWQIFPDHVSFDIVDTNGGNTPFRMKPNAKSFTFVIDVSNRVGVGTQSPLRNIHINHDDSPILRFEQNATLFTRQIYDVGGNDFGFFVDDVTASTQPFHIKPGAPSDSLVLDSSGNIGIGTSLPGTKLHLRQNAGSNVAETLARLSINDDDIGKIEINNATTSNGYFIPRLQGVSRQANAAFIMEGLISADSGVSPAIVYNAAKSFGGALGVRPLVVYRNNNVAKVTIAANGNVVATSFITASSRTLKDNIVDLDSKKAADALRQLNPVEFTYKDDPTADPRVGFIAEDVPEIVAESDRKSVPVMDIVAIVTRVVKNQQQTIDDQKKTIDHQKQAINEQRESLAQQQQAIEQLMKRLADVERRQAETATGAQ